MAIEKRRLGKTDIEITPIGLGCWQFDVGRGPMAIYSSPHQEEVNKIVRRALDGGINWFDTAEVYGSGGSEKALAAALVAAGRTGGDTVIATKWWPTYRLPHWSIPFFPRTAGNIARTIGTRQSCLAPCAIDLYQVHMPFSMSSVEAQMDEMAALVKAGKIRAVGVSNFSAARMRRAHAALAKHGIPLASNQVWFNLVHRSPEKNGVLEAARDLGVTIIAYEPLASGVLTGKFHKNPELVKKMRLFRRTIVGNALKKSGPLVNALDEIAQAHGRSTAEVALSWLVNFYGETVVAIPGATKLSHIDQNVGALTLKLTDAEMKRLDELSRGF